MKALLLVVFAILTDPQGRLIYVAPEQVVAILPPTSLCTNDSHARLFTSAGMLCVAEDMPDVKRKLEQAK
jgi:hypothetical protein